MVSKKSQSSDPNPYPNSSKHVLQLVGIPVEFPYQPYGSQLSFMSRVISTLDRAQRDGHCHALLESPTGTGKSLSLLCSALAWQKNHQSKILYSNISHSKPAPEAFTDPLAHGGGFVPEAEPSGNPEPTPFVANSKNHKKTPKIFYATRTHSQITQVIREYRKTTYRVPMAVLASRKHYCTNMLYRGKDNIDEQCKLLLKNQEVGCSEFKNVHKVKGHPSLQKGGCHEAHDIEDLLKVGQVVKGCSYFAARSMAEDAQLVFCPYNYIINPIIRRAMEVDIKGAIVILDEAHNIEDITRDAGSFDVDEDVLLQTQTELGQLSLTDAMTYQPLYETIENIISWIERRKKTLGKHEFQHYFTCWTGDKALRELQEASISQQSFPILQECATKAIKAASDAELDVAHLSGLSATILEGLFASLNYFYSGNGNHIHDYQLAIRRYIKRDAGNSAGGWTCTLSLWCLNPAVVFEEIADLSLSVILTSGTLSPMSSFSSELGVQFGTCLEAPHVIDVESQLWTTVISSGPGNYPLNASYKTADGYAFQDSLGSSLEEICKIVPAGCLIFFPSYKLMDKLCSRWRETGQWSRLNTQKSLFVEPRGGNQDDFDDTLKGYYDSIRQGGKTDIGRKKKGKNLGLKNLKATQRPETSKNGAAFLAVCRGKVSEGIDFSDENARVVIIVGIPFPNIHDIQVAQKKKFNDTYKSSKNLLGGSEWYCQQAFRALNQAAGRCIRHRFDYGAIIFIDERFCEERNTLYISKWLRKSIRQYDNFDKSLEGLQSFFRDIKERVGKNTKVLQNFDSKIEDIGDMDTSKEFTGKKIQKVKKSNCCGEKMSNRMLETGKAAQLCQSPTFVANNDFSPIQTITEAQAMVSTDKKDSRQFREYIDLECDIENYSRCLQAPPVTLSPDDQDVCIVEETPGIYRTNLVGSPESLSKDEIFSSSVPLPSTELPDQLVSHQMSLPNTSKSMCLVTPERNASTNTNGLIPETESSLDLSVNSHIQKRRKSSGWLSYNYVQEENFDTSDPKTPVSVNFMASSMTSTDMHHGNGSSHETNFLESKFEKSNVRQMFTRENCSSSSASSDHVMGKRLQIFCSLCRKPLGLSENDLYVSCSITSSSKIHLASLWKEMLQPPAVNGSSSVPIMVCDISSVDQRLCQITVESALGQGVWCKEDGCVFNTIFCPFCSNPNSCLGVQVMATDASNAHLLNKMLFYLDRLEIKNHLEGSTVKDLSPSSGSCISKCEVLNSIEKFSYSPQPNNSAGWRTTRSKMRLPKRGMLSNADA